MRERVDRRACTRWLGSTAEPTFPMDFIGIALRIFSEGTQDSSGTSGARICKRGSPRTHVPGTGLEPAQPCGH